jgi:hypothetical protein
MGEIEQFDVLVSADKRTRLQDALKRSAVPASYG